MMPKVPNKFDKRVGCYLAAMQEYIPVYKAVYRTSVLLFLLLLPALAQGQEWMGLSVSSYSGVHAGLANPAMLGITRLKQQIGIIGANSQINTNLLAYKGPRDIGILFKGYSLLGNTYSDIKNSNIGSGVNSVFSTSNWKWVNNGSQKYFSITGEVRGPFIGGAFGRFGWGLGYRTRAAVQIQNISPVLSGLIFSNQQQIINTFLNKGFKDAGFSATLNAYHEYYGMLGFPILQLGPHYLCGGVTLKYLGGMYSASITSNGFSYRFASGDSLITTEADISYRYIDSPVFVADPAASRGGGVGADMGVVYEWRNSNAEGTQYAVGQGTHKLRAGISVLDAGRISFTSSARKFDFKNFNVPTRWGQLDTLNVRDVSTLDSAFRRVYGARNTSNSFYTGLPTVLSVFADMQIIKTFYVSAMATQRLGTVSKAGIRSFSTFTIMPRLEHKIVEVGLPLTISTQYGSLQPGFYFRVSGFYIGSDNLSTLYKAQNRTGLSLYAGGYVPLHR